MEAGHALPLAGGPLAFSLARLIPGGEIIRATDIPWHDALERITRPVPPWAGIPVPAVMGILNVTPDSFSDGGQHLDPETAIAAARTMAADGAAIIDIGGESTRPGSRPVTPIQEQARILPVLRGLSGIGMKLSVDTRHAATMAASLDAGATIINDISALSHDPDALALVAARRCPVVLMHMRGTPETMGAHAEYGDVVVEIVQELAVRIAAAREAGISLEDIAVDPGIGFAKTAAHNLEVLRRLTGQVQPGARLAGSLAAALAAIERGAAIIRAHDVAETVQALRLSRAIARAEAELKA
jgi:dihydropteroate synthase